MFIRYLKLLKRLKMKLLEVHERWNRRLKLIYTIAVNSPDLEANSNLAVTSAEDLIRAAKQITLATCNTCNFETLLYKDWLKNQMM
jgi:hypothetical protein